MDVGETKGEHAESMRQPSVSAVAPAPAVEAASLLFPRPGNPHHSTFAAAPLLVAGLVGLVWLRKRNQLRN
jgi:hypothetical protein